MYKLMFDRSYDMIVELDEIISKRSDHKLDSSRTDHRIIDE